jgi:hypothetical protein
MAKKTAKKTKKEFEIIKKRSGRFAVKDAKGKYINGEQKIEILLKAKKIKLSPAKKKEADAKDE